MKKTIIGVMGPGAGAGERDLKNAYALGQLIAQQGWVLLTGGRGVGVMEAGSQGAKSVNGLTVGVLPNANTEGMSEAVDIAIFTDMGNGRNNINVLSSDVVIACGLGVGTLSEIALGIKNHKPVIILADYPEMQQCLATLAGDSLWFAETPEVAIEITFKILAGNR